MVSKKSGQKSMLAYNNWDTLIKYDSVYMKSKFNWCPIYLFKSDNPDRT